MRKKFQAAVLLGILIVPIALLFFVHFFGEQHFEKLSILGDKTPIENPDGSVDTVYHTVYQAYPDFYFPYQAGTPLPWDSLKGRIFVANLFHTRGEILTPTIMDAMGTLVEYFEDEPTIRFLSISIDPADTLPVLKEYAENRIGMSSRWYLISGDSASISDFLQTVFLLNPAEPKPGFPQSFERDNHFILVDRLGRIRQGEKPYDGTIRSSTELLSDEIKLLRLEYE